MSSEEKVPTIAEAARAINEERSARAAAPRTFELAGETFTHKPATTMEALADYYDMSTGRTDVSNHEAIEIIDRTVLAFLEPGQEKKWQKIRGHETHPLAIGEAHALIEALLTATTGRPTERPSSSTDGPESNGTTLTDVSPSKEPISTA